MRIIDIESGPASDKHSSDRVRVASLLFSESVMTVTVGDDPKGAFECPIWEHTVYELENLSVSLKAAALGHLPKAFDFPSEDVLLGPTVNLWPAVLVEVGHRGVTPPGCTATFYCATKASTLAKRRLVFLSVLCNGVSTQAVFEAQDALSVAEKLYEQAKILSAEFD